MPKPGDIPLCPAPPTVRSPGKITREYSISLVTPLFGGGVEAGVPDESLPIRATSIRGQLEFWWRATRGAGFATYQELFPRHAEIWGKTESASPVEIEVLKVTASPARSCASYEWNPNARQGQGAWQLRWEALFARSPLPYALFPFQGKEPASRDAPPEKTPAPFIQDASFTVRLRFPAALQTDVDAAVRAWANFGGLGARTRRGCGAIFCEELAPKEIDDLQRWLRSGSANGTANVRDWPTLPTSVLVGGQPEVPLDAWKKVVGLLKALRQDEGIGRNRGAQNNRPGRSRFPEPETIRRVTGRRAPRHPRLAQIPDDAFPRAEFGLPIVFHFQGQGEPPQTVLYPRTAHNGEPSERMASPLILKPLVLADGKAVPLIMNMATPPLPGVVLKRGNQPLDLPATTEVRAPRLASYSDSPLKCSASGSAIEAFLAYARANGFCEVLR